MNVAFAIGVISFGGGEAYCILAEPLRVILIHQKRNSVSKFKTFTKPLAFD